MNSLNMDLEGKVVVLKAQYYHGNEAARTFECLGGYGCQAATRGTTVYGRFLSDGETTNVRGHEIERLADQV